MNRILGAARLNFVRPLVSLGMPWLIASLSFVINLAIWQLTPAGSQDGGFTGGVLALYITVLVGFVQTVTQILPFAMGMSLSRRSFYLGTALVAVVESVAYGFVLAVLSTIEGATDGWGANMSFWTPGPMHVDNFALQILVSGAPMLAFAFVGMGIGVVSKRWGPSGAWVLSLGTTVFFGGLAVLLTWLQAWDELGRWLTSQTVETLAIGLPVALAAVVAAASFAGLRRIVP